MWRLGLASLFFATVLLLGSVLGSLSIVFSGILFENPWLVAFCVIAGASGLMGFLMVSLLGRQKLKEFAAGYTTSRLGYPNMEQVDESAGLIVRAAGEPLLTRQEHHTRVQAYRASLVDS
ncbi:hypothetical protein JF66_22325 [Cryobacterium sp. MLB-32]|nr:hypothetical protein JF66_22325 [Cryobacterium sp. MLB-32]